MVTLQIPTVKMNVPKIQSVTVPKPPQRLWKHQLPDMLAWYRENLCAAQLRDPRGHRLVFSLDRFPHMIKLLRRGSHLEVERPQKIVRAIIDGRMSNDDFGGYDEERAQTLTWIPSIILEPTMILEVVERSIWGKPGDTLLVKEFEKKGYRHKILVCRTAGGKLLVPVTCHPRDHKKKFGKAYRVVWPEMAKATS